MQSPTLLDRREQATWDGISYHRGNDEAVGPGQEFLRTLVVPRVYQEAVVAVLNSTFSRSSNEYCLMVIRAAVDSLGVTLSRNDDQVDDAQELGRNILRNLVDSECYVPLIDHAEMHQQEGCNCSGCA